MVRIIRSTDKEALGIRWGHGLPSAPASTGLPQLQLRLRRYQPLDLPGCACLSGLWCDGLLSNLSSLRSPKKVIHVMLLQIFPGVRTESVDFRYLRRWEFELIFVTSSASLTWKSQSYCLKKNSYHSTTIRQCRIILESMITEYGHW